MPTPLPAAIRQSAESAFKTDFSNVKVHINSSAAQQVGARAMTKGDEIHFAPGAYNPGSLQGQRLLAHELAHVVQQRKGVPKAEGSLQEREARVMAEAVLSGKAPVGVMTVIPNKVSFPVAQVTR